MPHLRRSFLRWLIRDVVPFDIPAEDGSPYLRRWVVTKLGVRFFVHHYLKNDPEPWLHDHPWWAVGIPIIGSYLEERLVRLCPVHGRVTKKRYIGTLRPNFIRTNVFHKIAAVNSGTWTLFFHGKRTGAFGFLETELKGDRWETRYHQPKDFVLEYSRNLMETDDG